MKSNHAFTHLFSTSTAPAAISISLILLLFIVACNSDTPQTNKQTNQPTNKQTDQPSPWTEAELAAIRSLWLGSLPPLPADPSNAVADDPRAAELGHQIFFDTRFSANGQVSCSTCHIPALNFTDGKPLSEAVGTTLRGAPTIVGTAYSPWFFWDGRRDSQWAQAITPMEDPHEHGGTRTQYAHLIDEDPAYRAAYEAIFGPMTDFSDRSRFPDSAGPLGDQNAVAAWEAMAADNQKAVTRAFTNIGKAIAAYERLIMPGPARFDQFAESLLNGDEAQANIILSAEERAGLRLFMGLGNCTQCHNGPLFTSHHFHNINLPNGENLPLDYGRITGLQEVLESEFNCFGPYSDAAPEQCQELRFVKTEGIELPGAFKVPTLRNVAETAPYMHAGQFAALSEVLDHYNRAPNGPIGHNEIIPINLLAEEQDQLEAFLRTLSGPLNVDQTWLVPPQ